MNNPARNWKNASACWRTRVRFSGGSSGAEGRLPGVHEFFSNYDGNESKDSGSWNAVTKLVLNFMLWRFIGWAIHRKLLLSVRLRWVVPLGATGSHCCCFRLRWLH